MAQQHVRLNELEQSVLGILELMPCRPECGGLCRRIEPVELATLARKAFEPIADNRQLLRHLIAKKELSLIATIVPNLQRSALWKLLTRQTSGVLDLLLTV